MVVPSLLGEETMILGFWNNWCLWMPWHRWRISRQLSRQCQQLECTYCGRLFAINHDVQVLLVWDDVKGMHDG